MVVVGGGGWWWVVVGGGVPSHFRVKLKLTLG